MATTLVDWLNDGTLPQTKTSGNWTPSAFNTGKFRQTWTPTNASSHSTWRPASLTYWAILTTNDVNGAALWLEWDPGGSTHKFLVVATDGSTYLASPTITWAAGASIVYVVDQSSASTNASTLTLSGLLTGNGTTAGWTRQSIFGGANLYLGVWGAGGFGINASTFSDIDDGNDSIAGTGTPTVAAVTGAGAGALALAGTSSAAVPAVTSAGAGHVALAGAGSPTVTAVTSAAAGAVAIAGTGSPSVGAFTSSGSGTLGSSDITGTGSPAMGDVAGAGTGALAIGVTGSPTVPAVTSAGAGAVAIAGAGAPTVGAPTSAASGALAIAGTGAPTVGAVTSVGAGSEAETVAWGVYDAERVLYGTAAGTVTTESLTTTNGSTFVIVTGGNLGDLATAPTDSKGNTYTLLGTPEEFDRWAGYGLALWVCVDGIGGSGHTFSQQFGQTLGFDEMTIAAAEVKAGHHVQGYTYAQALTGAALTFGAITTTAASILAAFFCGDAPTGATTTVSLSNGYTVDDTDTLPDHPNGYVPIAIAHADKPTAGSYSTTATESPDQGAIMVQVALQVAAVTAGTGTPTISAVTSSGSGVLTHAGQAAITVTPITSAGSGAVALAGGGSPSIAAPTSTAEGHVAIAGAGTPSVASVSASGAGTLPLAGAGGGAIDAPTVAGTGALPLAATGAATVPSIGSAASGALAVAGTGLPAVGNITASGAGTSESGALGTGSPAVGAVTAQGTGALPLAGAGGGAIADVAVAGAGALPIVGTGAAAAGAVTSSASGVGGVTILPRTFTVAIGVPAAADVTVTVVPAAFTVEVDP